MERAFAAGTPAAWVTGDVLYGRDRRLWIWLERQGRPRVLAIARNAPLWAATAKGPRQTAAGEGSTGPVRRNLTVFTYCVDSAPAGGPLEALVRVAGAR